MRKVQKYYRNLWERGWYRYFIELLNYAGAQLVELRYKSEFASSIPVGVTGMFYLPTPSSRTMTLGSTRISTRDIFWGVKRAGELGWQPYHLHVPIALKSGRFNLLDPSGPF
jgi:hypothetical protein